MDGYWRNTMSFVRQGDEVHGEVSTADASAGVAFTLYDGGAPTKGNSIAARVQTGTEFCVLTDIILISTAGGTFTMVFYPLSTGVIADTAGLRIAKGDFSATSGFAHHFETPRIGPPGYGVGLVASIGQVDGVITGGITKV
jgi:hypothetical protein